MYQRQALSIIWSYVGPHVTKFSTKILATKTGRDIAWKAGAEVVKACAHSGIDLAMKDPYEAEKWKKRTGIAVAAASVLSRSTVEATSARKAMPTPELKEKRAN